jgi:hypothetical protein
MKTRERQYRGVYFTVNSSASSGLRPPTVLKINIAGGHRPPLELPRFLYRWREA